MQQGGLDANVTNVYVRSYLWSRLITADQHGSRRGTESTGLSHSVCKKDMG